MYRTIGPIFCILLEQKTCCNVVQQLADTKVTAEINPPSTDSVDHRPPQLGIPVQQQAFRFSYRQQVADLYFLLLYFLGVTTKLLKSHSQSDNNSSKNDESQAR